MINIPSLFESSKPARSLLMTYCACLPFFEQDILPYLQQTGEGRVTVLVDDIQYDASFSDFVIGAGTRYRIQPIRLRNRLSNFHPKLYLFVSDSNVDLLVGSANLTPSGFRANAEIVDRLSHSQERHEDGTALLQYLAMLQLFPSLDPRLPDHVIQQIEELASHLNQLLGDRVDNNRGPWFLHTVQETLLAQVSRLISPATINHITAISPFYDEQSLAVLKLAETFGNARIRLIKDAEAESLNGKPLTILGSRITVEEFSSLTDDEQRRLHAKLLILQSDAEEWVITGSANLTRAAWLSTAMSARTAGNLEAVVVRRLQLGSTVGLLKSVKTATVDFRTLRKTTSPPNSLDAARFIIVDAILTSREITIVIEPVNTKTSCNKHRVFLEQAGRRIPIATSKQDHGNRVCLTGSVQNHKLDYDWPLTAIVEVDFSGARSCQVRSWVSIPSSLAFNSSQRNVRSAARDICRRVFQQDDAASVIADAITRFLTELGGMAPHHEHGSHSDQSQNNGADLAISKDDFLVDDDALGVLHTSRARTAEALSGLASLLDQLLIAADDANELAAPSDSIEEETSEDEQDGTGDETGKRQADRKKKTKRAIENLERLDAAFRDTLAEALQQRISEEIVPFLMHLPNAAIAYVLLHAQIRRQLGLITGYTVEYDLRRILKQSFSIDGLTAGGSFGWLVRAWASTRCRHRIEQSLETPGTVDQLLAFVAAGLTFGGPFNETDTVALGILAGAHLVIGRIPGTNIEAPLRERLAAISHSSGGVLDPQRMEAAIAHFSPNMTRALSSFRGWMLLKKLDESVSDQKLHSTEVDYLRRTAPGLLADYLWIRERQLKPLAQAFASESGMRCGTCQMRLPGATVPRLSAPLPDYVKCDNCHRILCPVDLKDGISEQVASELESMVEVQGA